LDWVGKSSEFNSCLPADITSYEAPPYALPSISEDEMQISVSALRDSDLGLAVRLYSTLDYLSAPRFAHRRLHLPCVVFPVTEFSHARPTRQSFLLVHPWDRHLLGLPDFEDDTQSEDGWTALDSPSQDSPSEFPGRQKSVDSELVDRALRLIVRLGKPFSAFLLAQQRGGEYKRIASDHDII
ncbi:hypothetical protein CY34DRAFT_27709, partial [Suillus luteus UH-Slu-Lm8-n1]